MSGSGRQATNGKKLPTQQPVNVAVRQILDITRRSNCAGAIQGSWSGSWRPWQSILSRAEADCRVDLQHREVSLLHRLDRTYRCLISYV